MLQYQLEHMELEKRQKEMARTQLDAKNSYNDFNILMMVAGIMVANNITTMTAVDYAPGLHAWLFDATGAASVFSFFYVLMRAPFLIALATHLGENGPARTLQGDSAMRLALDLFRNGAAPIFFSFGLGLLMAALNFVLDTPPPLDPDAEPAASFASLTGVDVTRLAMCALWLARASADLRRDVRKFVDGLGEVCDPIQHAGYGWVWWFGPFNGPADGGAPLSLRNARRRAVTWWRSDASSASASRRDWTPI